MKKCWVWFLPRCRAVCPVPRPTVSKLGEKSLPPQNCDLPGFWGFLGDVTDLHGSEVLCHQAMVLWVFVKQWDTSVVKTNNCTLSYVLLISLLLCFLCSLLFIGHPNRATCILQQITLGTVFTVAVATGLAKTLTVILAFKARKPGRTMRRLLETGASNDVIPLCSIIQVILCGVWRGTSPPFLETDTHSEPKELIIVCKKDLVTDFYSVLGYLGSLALVR